MLKPNKILILSITRLGDIIQSLPFVRRLRSANPDCDLHVLVEKCFADVVDFWPGERQLHMVRLEDLLPPLTAGAENDLSLAARNYGTFIERLKREQFDEVWNLTHTRPAMVLAHILAGENGRGVTLDVDGLQRVNSPWLTYFFATNLARPWCQFNLVDIYANCVDSVPWDLHRTLKLERASYETNLASVPPRTNTHRIALHVGASQVKKQWTLPSFRRVAEMLIQRHDVEIVLVGSARDANSASAFSNLKNVCNCIGQTSVKQLAAWLSQCDLLISSDSGPMHVAAGVGTPVVDITLGSALGSETAPYGENHIVVEPDSPCFPCAAKDNCAHTSCAARISPESVVALMEWRLGLRKTVEPDDLKGARVYRTHFSKPDGLLELERLFSQGDLERDRLNRILRPFWLHVLSNRPLPSIARESCHATFSHTASEARRFAHICQNIAQQLTHAANKTRIQRRTVENLALLLRQQENRLAHRLSGVGILNSLHIYSNLRRASLRGASLAEQAAETAEIYGELQVLLSAFNAIETGVAKQQHSNITPVRVS